MEPLPRQARSGPRQNLHEDMKKQRLSLAYKSWLAGPGRHQLMSYCQDELATRAGTKFYDHGKCLKPSVPRGLCVAVTISHLLTMG